VPIAENEAVAIDPLRIRRIVPHDLAEEGVSDWSKAHGSACTGKEQKLTLEQNLKRAWRRRTPYSILKGTAKNGGGRSGENHPHSPGWPELLFSTMSAARQRMVLMHLASILILSGEA
jgi:hypothetical protein